MKQKIFNSILVVLLCSFVLSCTINNETLFEKEFVFVKGATIEGAIQADGYTESPGFVAGKKVTIADFYMCDHEVTQKEFALYYEGYEYRINENETAVGYNYPAYDVFTASHRFWVVVFSFSFVSMHILISSVICWLFSSVLFSLHMLEFLIVFLL